MLLLNSSGAGRKRETVPIFPLSTVLFPGSLLPLSIFEVRYMDMAKACLKTGALRRVPHQGRRRKSARPRCRSRWAASRASRECDMEELGILKVKAEGLERFRIVAREVNAQGLIVGEIERLAPRRPTSATPRASPSAPNS